MLFSLFSSAGTFSESRTDVDRGVHMVLCIHAYMMVAVKPSHVSIIKDEGCELITDTSCFSCDVERG